MLTLRKYQLLEEGVKGYQLAGRDYARALARSRDRYTCQDCGLVRKPQDLKKGQKSLDIHHLGGQCGKNSRGYDSIKTLDGLITLCHLCHYARHDFSKEGRIAMRRKVLA